MSDNQKSDISESGSLGAAFCFSMLALAIAAYLASQIGSEVKWLSGRPLVNQPGFWPVMAIFGMMFCWAFEVLISRRKALPLKAREIASELMVWAKALEYVVWFLIYVSLVPKLGYLPCTIAFSVLLALRVGYRSAKTLASAALVGVATVVIFKSFLAVKIPGGEIYDLLPAALRNFMIIYL